MRSDEIRPVSSPDGFEAFVATHERRLRQALTASFGIDRGREAAAVAVMLVNGFDWSLAEVAEFLGVSKSTVQTHAERAMAKLRAGMGVDS